MDGLRAVAILSVVVHHAAKNMNLQVGPLQHTLYEGSHGVDLFFVISGFVLAYPTLAKLRNGGFASFDVARFYAHRLIRILPPYYFAVGFCWLLWFAMQRLRLEMPWGVVGPAVSPVEIFKQMVFADLHPQFLNGSFWSLAVEFRWYFLFPLLLALWIRSPRAFGLVWVALIIVANFTRAAGLDAATLPAFMLGIMAADIEIRKLPIRRLAGLLTVLALCIALALEPREPYEFFNSPQLGWHLTSFFFLVAAGAIPALRKVLSLRPLLWIGFTSYSIYLIHEPLMALVLRNSNVGFFGACAVGIGAGIAFWFVFERPFVTTLKAGLTDVLSRPIARAVDWLGVPTLATFGKPQDTIRPVASEQPSEPEAAPATA
jgi:peptidoglycan/LPS O-acetylase OafA/YrhL